MWLPYQNAALHLETQGSQHYDLSPACRHLREPCLLPTKPVLPLQVEALSKEQLKLAVKGRECGKGEFENKTGCFFISKSMKKTTCLR